MQVYFSMPGGNIEKQEYSMESSQLTQHSSELIGSFCRQTGQNGHVLDRFCRIIVALLRSCNWKFKGIV